MKRFAIFLLIIIGAIFFYKEKEPFCQTLRCRKSKYSLTSLKNTLSNRIRMKIPDHIANVNSWVSDFKDSWL